MLVRHPQQTHRHALILARPLQSRLASTGGGFDVPQRRSSTLNDAVQGAETAATPLLRLPCNGMLCGRLPVPPATVPDILYALPYSADMVLRQTPPNRDAKAGFARASASTRSMTCAPFFARRSSSGPAERTSLIRFD